MSTRGMRSHHPIRRFTYECRTTRECVPIGAEVNRGYLDLIHRWSRSSSLRLPLLRSVKQLLQILLSPFVLLFGAALVPVLRLVLARRGASQSRLHEEALPYVESFVEQYPLHLYPVVAKALELAHVTRRLEELIGERTGIVEIAIGEGTLSSRMFGDRHRVTGLDLNPFSLAKAAALPHVERAIVCDGLRPPVRAASFDLLLSLNFLHHVTEKQATVAAWARIAGGLLFNENTPYWASSWAPPYLLRHLGLVSLANRYAKRVERRSLQRLKGRPELEAEIGIIVPLRQQVSFLSERSFFVCSLFSWLMVCYGPPTPAVLKALFLGPLRFIAVPLTKELGRLLVRFDAGEDRTKDTFVFFEAGDVTTAAGRTPELMCPRCEGPLDGARCTRCGTAYPVADGMLFLLPPQFAYVYDDYTASEARPMPAEHL